MITIAESQELMKRLSFLRKKLKKTESPKDKLELEKHEELCYEQFKYLITMHTARYKAFSNYEDLVQEGALALFSAMKTYQSKRGKFFWWAHKYISTRISRSANAHTTIRYPLKFAQKITPHKELSLPTLIENNRRPDSECESFEVKSIIESLVAVVLTEEQVEIISRLYGLDGGKPMSVNKICKELNLTRTNCIKIIENALSAMKDKIRL